MIQTLKITAIISTLLLATGLILLILGFSTSEELAEVLPKILAVIGVLTITSLLVGFISKWRDTSEDTN